MIKLENYEVVGWEHALRGMRNPMNSWDRADSYYCLGPVCPDDAMFNHCGDECLYYKTIDCENNISCPYIIGKNDHDRAMKLSKGGPVHAKYRRMIDVYVDITAPLYWWKEFDTYKVGTVSNSCSTMHKIQDKEFTLEDFSCEHLSTSYSGLDSFVHMSSSGVDDEWDLYPENLLRLIIIALNKNRRNFIELSKINEEAWKNAPKAKGLSNYSLAEAKKKYWWQMIQLLPSSYNQRRTIKLNYEVLANIYKWRKSHKLDEWREFCKWIESLPYSELITLGVKEEEVAE